jgi:hypothetical protein
MNDAAGFFALDTDNLPWEVRSNPHLPAPILRNVLNVDVEMGVFFQLVRYPRGVVTVLLVSNKSLAIQYMERTQ